MIEIVRLTMLAPIFVLASVPSSPAALELSPVFSDHAVLQRDKPLPIWGRADPGEKVEVGFGGSRATTTAGDDGKWMVELEPQPVSGAPQTLTIAGGSGMITREDILVGDVWLCGGQSNMDMGLGGCDVPQDIAAADHPQIRHFRVAYHFANAPVDSAEGNWLTCTPGSVPGFSAAAYYFARKVHAETGVPIGLLTSAVGGTNIELWISQQTLLETASLESYAGLMRESLVRYDAQLRAIMPAAHEWSTRGLVAIEADQPMPMPPVWPDFPFAERVARPRCVTLHNGMIAPLVPLALRGCLWYQGENNAGDPLYVEKKRALIGEWRRLFRDPDLPFYFVQLAAWQAPDATPAGGGWGMIRDLQRQCLSIPHTGMACAIDIGDAADIHPKNKADVGERLALWALRNEYGQPELVASGPLYREMAIEADRIRLRFDWLGGGLVVGSKRGRDAAVIDPAGKLARFAIAGADRQWEWAEAVIDGDEILVHSPRVPNPVAVRYAYSSNPEGAKLYNRAGLPASPFRTDPW